MQFSHTNTTIQICRRHWGSKHSNILSTEDKNGNNQHIERLREKKSPKCFHTNTCANLAPIMTLKKEVTAGNEIFFFSWIFKHFWVHSTQASTLPPIALFPNLLNTCSTAKHFGFNKKIDSEENAKIRISFRGVEFAV